VTADSSWSLNDALTRKLLTDFYPPTEELDTTQDRNEIQTATLSAKPISRKGSILRVQLDGKLVMKHSFYANPSDNFTVNATLLGWIEFDTAKARITDFQLTTKHATYGGGTAEDFNAALYSVSDSVLP
jgi:hypothetical protein